MRIASTSPECAPDIDDATKPVNRINYRHFSKIQGGQSCLPHSTQPMNIHLCWRETFKECLAFIQLLGPYPWRRGDFDRLQSKAAEELENPAIPISQLGNRPDACR